MCEGLGFLNKVSKFRRRWKVKVSLSEVKRFTGGERWRDGLKALMDFSDFIIETT